MPAKAIKLANKFIKRARELERTRAKIEAILQSGNLEIIDVEQVYAGFFLDIFTELETLIEDLFFGYLTGAISSPVVKRNVKFLPVSRTAEVVHAGKPFLDWLPYKTYTLKRAKIFFDNGEPFSLLTESHLANLKNYSIIRNAIAHKSVSAHKKFQDMINHLPLLPIEKTPAGYLRSKPSATQTQYEIAVIELEIIANTLCS